MDPSSALGQLEMKVLGLLEAKEARSVRQVQDDLARQGHEVAYTTVMTVLGRLYEKGVLLRDRDGNRYLYRTAQGASRVKTGILGRVHRMFRPSERAEAVATLIADEALEEGELLALRALIDEKIAEKAGKR